LPRYRVERLHIAPASTHFYEQFSHLTEESFRCCLLGENPYQISSAQVIAIAAFEECDAPVGLLLASLLPAVYSVEVHSLFVEPAHRNRGIARQLLKQLELELPKGVQLLFVYPLNSPDTAALEKALSALQWGGKRPFMIRSRFDASKFHPPWIDLVLKYPPGVEEFFWSAISQQEQEELRCQEQQGRFLPALSPFHHAEKLEPLNSLGVRYQGKVIGWCLTHRIKNDLT
jgi:GNAT superfamily N-acetyltransferase